MISHVLYSNENIKALSIASIREAVKCEPVQQVPGPREGGSRTRHQRAEPSMPGIRTEREEEAEQLEYEYS